MHHVYDTIIYPPRQSSDVKVTKSIPARITGWFLNLMPSSNDKPGEKETKQDELSILETRVLRRTCLEIYLHKELEMIHTGKFYDRASDLEHIVDHMIYVYDQLHSPLVQDDRKCTTLTCGNLKHVRNVHADG